MRHLTNCLFLIEIRELKFSKKLWIILSFKRINLLLKTEPLNYLSKDMHLFLSKSDYVSTKVISLQPFDKHVDLVFSFWQALEVSTSSFPFYRKKKSVFMNSLRRDFISFSSGIMLDAKVWILRSISILQKWLQQSTTLT